MRTNSSARRRSVVVLLSLLLLLATSVVMANEVRRCGPSGSTIKIAGSSTVQPIAATWAQTYIQQCQSFYATSLAVTVEGGGSSAGASRVCLPDTNAQSVDIGDMSRPWKASEGVTTNGYLYQCTNNAQRYALQLDVALDGLTVAVKRGGVAAQCLEQLSGGGLTVPQLRWMYSNYSAVQMQQADGWDAATTVPFLNDDDEDRLWSELNENCPNVPIQIAGADALSGTHDYFLETTLFQSKNTANPEYFHQGSGSSGGVGSGYFNSPDDNDIVQYLQDNDAAIAFFGFSYYYTQQDVLQAVPIQNQAGTFVLPTPDSIEDGSYQPYSRRIYMNLWQNPTSLQKTRPFMEYALSSAGTRAMEDTTGHVGIPEWERIIMLSRVGARGGVNLDGITCPGTNGLVSIAGSSTVFPVAELWAGLFIEACPGILFSVEGGGSSAGAERVCAAESTSASGGAVDIGTMSRDFNSPTEATTVNDWYYQCQQGGDTTRNVIQVDVAIDGLAVVTKQSGRAHACLQKIIESEGGLTLPQLRWMFSSYTDAELTASGTWKASSIPHLNQLTETLDGRYWSELNLDCDSTEIIIAGPDNRSGTYAFFRENVLDGYNSPFKVETFDTTPRGGLSIGYYNSDKDEDIVQYLLDNEDAIGLFGYSYYYRNAAALTAVPIQNRQGNFVVPDAVSIEDGTYNPFARRIYMNIWDDDSVLELVRFWLEFGLSVTGRMAMEDATGYRSIPDWETFVMLSRIGAAGGVQATDVKCGPSNPVNGITVAGSSTVYPIAKVWAGIYELYCNTIVHVEGGGSSVGASRVCNDNPSIASGVDIGTMSREWKSSEAVLADQDESQVKYQCTDNSDRFVVQVPVAIDGLSVVVQIDGNGARCISHLGGLTLDQLRWIYSSYTRAELVAAGWDATSVGTDNDDSTHLWSELSANKACPNTEIRISGPDVLSGTYEYFLETVLTDFDRGETFDLNRPHSYLSSPQDDTLVIYVTNFPDAISFFGSAYYFNNADQLFVAPIQNPTTQRFVVPNENTVSSGTYAPFSRRLYMNLWDDTASLSHTVPFLQFGISEKGEQLVRSTGYTPIPPFTSLQPGDGTIPGEGNNDSGGGGMPSVESWIIGVVVGCTLGLSLFVCLCIYVGRKRRDRRYAKEQEEAAFVGGNPVAATENGSAAASSVEGPMI